MFVFSLILFAAVLLVLAAAAARGLTHIDDILEIVEPDSPATDPSSLRTHARG